MNRKFPFTLEEFKAIYSQVPRLSVDLLVVRDDKFLLTLRRKNGFLNQWHFPGGTVYMRESIIDCVRRIASEELGLSDITIEKYVGYIEYFSELKERGYGFSVSLVFLCRLPPSADITLDSHAAEFAFFDNPPKNTIKEPTEFLLNLKRPL